jgi:nucleoside-diphosphate-sugar epimerase
MTTVLVTGASGFIARRLGDALQRDGMRTIGASRSGQPLPAYHRVFRASLGDSLRPLFESERVDAVVHAALDSGPHSYAVNVEGATRCLEEANTGGAKLQILLSCLSASADSLTDQGRARHALEQRFLTESQVVLRLGMVVGEGGRFAELVDSVRRNPVVPLLDGSEQLVYVLGIDLLCHVLRDCIHSNGGGLRGRAWNLQQPIPYTLGEVIQAVTRAYGFRRLLLPMPSRPMLGLLQLFEKQRLLRLPITSSNVKGLIQGGHRRFSSDFARFGYPPEALQTLVNRAAHPPARSAP